MSSVIASRRQSRTIVRRRTWPGRLGIRLVVPALAIITWQLAGNDSARIDMPTFTRTMSSLGTLLRNGQLLHALADSNLALVWGYLAALAVGLLVGAAMAGSRFTAAAFAPYITGVIIVPLIALIPLIQAIFGIGLMTRTVVVAIDAFPYIAINTELGVRSVPPDLTEMAKSFGFGYRRRLRKLVFPHAFPYIMAGARLALGRGVVAMVVADLFVASSGIGSLLTIYRARFDSGAVFAIALSLVLEGILLISLAQLGERLVVKGR